MKRFLWAVALPLVAIACANPQQPLPASDGPVQPKVNRLVVAMPAPAMEGNNPSRLQTPPIVQLKASYEYLMAVSTENGKLIPQLATEWKLEPDAKSYRFKLRQGIKFHDDWGEMTSKDVAFTMWDLSHPESLHTYSPDYRTLVEKVEEVNDHEFVFRLTRPDAAFLSNISQQLSGLEIHSKTQFDAKGNPTLTDRSSAGTGPYQFKERTQGAFIRFERVPYQHWRTTPDFPELELRWVNEASTRLAAMLTGEIQMAPIPTDLQAQAERQGMKTATGTIPGVRLFLRMHGTYLNDLRDPSKGYKFPESPLMDIRVRRALNKAVNREELSKTLFGGKTQPLILNHYHPTTRKGWNPDWEKRFPEAYGYDAAKARVLLHEAGYGPSRPLSTNMIMVNLAEVPNSQYVQEAIATYWRAAGIQTQLLNIDRAEYTRRNDAHEWNNHIDIFAAPSDQFTGVWVFNSFTGRRSSGTVVHVPEVDSLFQKVRAELDEPRQEALWRQLGDATFDQVQHVPLFWLPVEMMYNPTIVGEYVFPGSISGLYTHLETIKAAR